MNQKKILLQLLPGFIPILLFIAADEIWGTKVGLIVAVVSGLIELAWYWFKEKRFDKFVLIDTLLVVGLGIVSILLDNDIFFKLKPALIGILMCAVIGVSAFTPANFLFDMSKRYMKGIEFTDAHYVQMRQNLNVLFWILVAYTVLMFYSVWFMSKEAWAFISGGLFYILFGVYFGYEFIKNKISPKKISKEEWLPLVNEKGEIIGKAPRSICHTDKKFLHPVVHLHVLNSKGEIFLQKRPMHKKVQPGKWDTAVGGHISFGENIETALKRETEEEIGISEFKPELVANYIWESDIERELVFCFVTTYNGSFKISKEELSEGRFWSQQEIEKLLQKGMFTPNFELEFKSVLSRISFQQ